VKQKNIVSILIIIGVLLSTNCQSISGILATETPTITATATATATQTPRPTATRRPSPTPTPEAGRYTSPDGFFSFVMPEGWEVTREDNDIIQISGPEVNNFNPNLVASQVEGMFMLEGWSAMFQDEIMDSLEGYSLISEDFIQTDTGETCFRWEFKTTRQGKAFHHIFYMYESGDWKLVIAYTRLEKAGTEEDAMIEASMRSVIYER
jgi:hypothetical protein